MNAQRNKMKVQIYTTDITDIKYEIIENTDTDLVSIRCTFTYDINSISKAIRRQ